MRQAPAPDTGAETAALQYAWIQVTGPVVGGMASAARNGAGLPFAHAACVGPVV